MSKGPSVVEVEEYKPSVCIYLQGKQLDLSKLKMGKSVTIMLKGKLKGIAESTNSEGRSTQDLTIEDPKAKIAAANYFTDVSEEDS
jgi:hypothetical protein